MNGIRVAMNIGKTVHIGWPNWPKHTGAISRYDLLARKRGLFEWDYGVLTELLPKANAYFQRLLDAAKGVFSCTLSLILLIARKEDDKE